MDELIEKNAAKKAKIKQKKKNLSNIQEYSYDTPITLCQPIKDDQDPIPFFYYIIENKTNCSFFALLTTLPLSDIPNFELLIANKGGDWENNEKMYNYWREMLELQKTAGVYQTSASKIFNELFSKEYIIVHPKGKIKLSKKELTNYFKFYVKFFGDIYAIPPNNIASTFYSLNEIPSQEDMNRRTYLVLPATPQHNIDEAFMVNYFKNLNPEYSFESSLAYKIQKLRSTPAVLEQFLRAPIFETTYGNHAKYYYVEMILDPTREKATKFMEMVARYFEKKSYSEILEMFNLTPETAEQFTVDYLLYEHKIADNIEFIGPLRRLDNKYNLKTDRTLPIMFVQPPLTPNTFDFYNMTKILHNYPSCRKHKVTVNSMSFFPMIPTQYLRCSSMTIAQLDTYMRIPSIMSQIERYVITNEFRGLTKIIARTEDLCLAMTTSSYDPLKNNEVLETLGDTVLKFLTSFYLYVKEPLFDESKLTERRIKYITNEYLLTLGKNVHVPYFLKTIKKNATDWRLPYMKQEEKLVKHLLTGKQIADCVEAIIGACFVLKFDLYYPLCCLRNLGFPMYGFIIDTEAIRNSCIIIPEKFIPQEGEAFNEDITYEELNAYFRPDQPDTLRRYKAASAYTNIKKFATKRRLDKQTYSYLIITNILVNFERKILKYSFKNKSYLLQAVTKDPDHENPLMNRSYETLEFLGDSIIELYVLANGYYILKQLGKEITPELLQNLKISLLSNSFMARLAVMNNFQRYLYTESNDILREVEGFMKKVEFYDKFKCFVKHQYHIPKALSDMFEALAAAVWYDGGWKAFHNVFGRMLGPYIKFFCLYHLKMQTNIVEKLKLKALEE